MRKVLLFGNSGSGKSTLAKQLREEGQAHLDLDTLAWQPTSPPQRTPLAEACQQILAWTQQHENWVVEGCYTDLMECLKEEATEVVFLRLSVEECQDNARSRPWEPHKYESKEAQDANLSMLLDWIQAYPTRDGVFSLQAHQAFFDGFEGTKTLVTTHKKEVS